MSARLVSPCLALLLATGAAQAAGPARPWIEGSRFSTNGIAVTGDWIPAAPGVRARRQATIGFATASAPQFYLKIRYESPGQFRLRLNGEELEIGQGLVIRPGGGVNWSALPDRSLSPAGAERHSLEIICRDGCLDVWLDNASAGFGSWKQGAGLTNGSIRVESEAVNFTWLEWRGIEARPAEAAPPAAVAASAPGPADPPPEMPPVVPEPPPAAAPAAGAPMDAVRALLRKPGGITWIFAGDSITLGGHFTGGGRSYPEHFQERIRWEMRRFDDAVINTAFNGATTDKLAKVLDQRVLRHRPQVVFLMIGSNDARRGLVWLPRFREWLDVLVTRMREAGAVVVLQTANHPVSNRDGRLLMEDTAYMQAVREAAERNGVALIDHWALWEDFHADHAGQYNWMGDAIHPNARGHLQMAFDIFRELGLYDQASRVVRLGEDPEP